MKVKITMLVAVVILACVIQAQDVAQILSELKTKPVAESVIESPAVSAPAEAVKPDPAAVVAVPVAVQPAAVTEDVLETVAVSTEPSGGGTIKGGLISVSLKEVEINSVIRIFSTLSDANIIVPALEAGAGAVKVDVNLKDVEWKPALQAILETQNLELYEKVPGSLVYSVRKKPADAPLTMNVKIFRLDYASVSNVNEMIKTMVPQTGPSAGKISIFPSRNTIVVQSTPENLMEIQAMIAAVDLPRQQVFIEAKFMELTDNASEKLGIDWAMMGGYGIGVTGIGGSLSNSSTLTENRYTDISGRAYENGVGVDGGARLGSFDPDATRVSGITPTTLTENKTTSALGATLSASDFKLVLAALKDINGAKVVSNPKIIVANEQTAQIYIGDKEPNVKQATTQAQQADAVTTYNLDPAMPFFETGIKLDVTPTINTSSNITVTISPSLSHKTGEKKLGDKAGATLPINVFPYSSEKTIKTVFSLESGQTAAIGGLTELTTSDVDRKIPLLGSLPLIGRFFSYSEKNNKQVETVIFVTVGLANPASINMETGLPQDSKLAMRYDASATADRQIEAEKKKLLKQHESERAQEAVKKLQNAEQKRLQKQK